MPKLVRALVVIALAIGIGILVWMILAALGRVQNVVTAILFAALFAYAIFPAVQFLSMRMPRAVAVIVVYVVAVGAVGFTAAYLAPTIAAESVSLSRTFPSALSAVEKQLTHPATSSILNRFPPEVRAFIAHNAAQAAAIGATVAGYLGERTIGVLRGAVAFLIDMLLVF